MLAEPTTQLTDKLITGEELFRMGDLGRTELVEGRIVYLMPTGRPHSRIEFIIAGLLFIYNRLRNFGEVHGGEIGIFTRRNPDTVRGMDVALISHERLAYANENGFLTVAPELIVEVMSPSDRWAEVLQKLDEYFAVDAKMVWIVEPKTEQIYVYRSQANVEIFTKSDTLTCEDVLPDFSLELHEVFGTQTMYGE